MVEMSFHGDKELVDDFHRLTESYYDYAHDAAKRAGREYLKLLRKQVRSSGLRSTKNLMKGFKIDGPISEGSANMRLEFMGEGKGRRNPHWHLIEDGHELIRPNINQWGRPYKDAGAHLGSVAGKHNVQALDDTGLVDELLEKEMTKALDEALEAGHFK